MPTNPNIVNTTQALVDEAKKKYWEQAYNQSIAGKTVNIVPLAPPIQNPVTPAPTWPVPWSASSILWTNTNEADQFAQQLATQNQADYNQVIDPQAIYDEKLKQSQAQIDALNAVYQDQINQARVQGQGRLGSWRAMQARSGLLGSDFWAAQTAGIENANQNDINEINRQKSLELQALYSGVRQSAESEKAAKEKARKEGGDAYLAYLQGKQTRKQQLVKDSAAKLLSLGVDPNTVSDAEWKSLWIDKNDVIATYNDLADTEKAKTDKTALETKKTNAEISKLEADAIATKLKSGEYYEAGGRIYNPKDNSYVTDARSVANATSGVTWTAWFSAPIAWGFRTDRNNNPTAMTTDVARSLGLVEWVDYTRWDVFPNNPNLFTAKILGNPIDTTIKALDTAATDPNKNAFTTQSGQPRWTYINMTDQQWQAMTPEQKKETITTMYKNEWGTGILAWNAGLSDLAQSVLKGIITIDKIPAAQRAWIAQELARAGTQTPRTKEIQYNIDLVDELLNSPSLKTISGNIQWRLPWALLGSDAQLALNQYEQLRNSLSLDSREKLKGTGAISDFESKMLASAASALGRNLSDADFQKELQKIRDVFAGKYKYLTGNEANIEKTVSSTTNTPTAPGTTPSGLTYTVQ